MFKIILLFLVFNFVIFMVKGANTLVKSFFQTNHKTAFTQSNTKPNKTQIDERLKGITHKIKQYYAEDIDWEEV